MNSVLNRILFFEISMVIWVYW